MKIISPYKTHPVLFPELYHHDNWTIKICSLSSKQGDVDTATIRYAKENFCRCIFNFESKIVKP